MQYDFSSTQIHAHHVKLLKRLNRSGPVLPGDADIEALFMDGLIQPTKRSHASHLREVEISNKGKLYLQWRKEDMFRHRWPVYLSIAAILVSLAAFIQSFFF